MTSTITRGLSADRIREREHEHRIPYEINVGDYERLACGLGGTLLVVSGLKEGTWRGAARALFGGALLYRGVTGHSKLYEMLGVSTVDTFRAAGGEVHKGIKVQHALTVNRSPRVCYEFWRNLENLPTFMTHLESVRADGPRHTRWVARAPLGRSVAWVAEVIADKPDELIAWQSVAGSDVDHAGSVRFRPAPGGRGTEVTVELNYEPPAGTAGRVLAQLFGEEPERQIREDLRHFKQVMETGEIPAVAGQPSGRGTD